MDSCQKTHFSLLQFTASFLPEALAWPWRPLCSPVPRGTFSSSYHVSLLDLHFSLSAGCFPSLHRHALISPLMPSFSVAIYLSLLTAAPRKINLHSLPLVSRPHSFFKLHQYWQVPSPRSPSYTAWPLLTQPFCSSWHYWPVPLWILSSLDLSVFFPPTCLASFCSFCLSKLVCLRVHFLDLLLSHSTYATLWQSPISYFLSCQAPWRVAFGHRLHLFNIHSNPQFSSICVLFSKLNLNCSKIHPLFWNQHFSPYLTQHSIWHSLLLLELYLSGPCPSFWLTSLLHRLFCGFLVSTLTSQIPCS